ncbi:MAG: MBL fold metallo-hydrolase [Burkholderiaceae bacterium]
MRPGQPEEPPHAHGRARRAHCRRRGPDHRQIIDTGPDFRQQMLMAGVKRIDAVVYTHPHADHIHGIDDLRGFVLDQRRLIDVHADQFTMARLREGFGYCFETPPGISIRRSHCRM